MTITQENKQTTGQGNTCLAAFEKAYRDSKQKARRSSHWSIDAMKNSLKECTFSPSINETRIHKNFDTFLFDQFKREHQKEERIAELITLKEKDEISKLTPIPAISQVK